jgi:hypothetical protein
MKKQLLSEEFTRMQKMAGIISEIKVLDPKDINFYGNIPALGILFNYSDEEPETPYEWDDKEIRKLVKSLGYKDWKDIAGEVTLYFPPDDEDFLITIRDQENRPNIEVKDLTIGMIIKNILQEFPYELGEPIEADSYVPKVKDVEVDNSFKTKQNPKLKALIEKYKDELIDKFELDRSAVEVIDYGYYPEVGIGSPYSGFVKSVKFITPEDWEENKKYFAQNQNYREAKNIKIGGVDLKYYINQ